MDVYMKFMKDMGKDASHLLIDVLDADIDILGYYGEYDFICNWEGGLKWMKNLKWSGSVEFNDTKIEEVEYGLMKRYGKFGFLKFAGAGHMVPMDQPEKS